MSHSGEQSSAKTTFAQSLPVIVPAFVNKSGDIGMRLFPMLLVERSLSADQSAMVMGLVKGTLLFSAFAGGLLGDRIGNKRTILLSLLLSGCGMLLIPYSLDLWLLCSAGMLATFGQGLFNAPLRVLLIRTVNKASQRDALAWLRTAHNGAVMTASAITYLTSGIGMAALFLFDAGTSLLSVFVGKRILPNDHTDKMVTDKPVEPGQAEQPLHYMPIVVVTLIIAVFFMQTELFFVGASAQAKISFGAKGVTVFSQVMMINTLLCMLLSVVFTKFLRNVLLAFTVGLALQGLAIVLIVVFSSNMQAFFYAVFLQTIGELTFAAMSQFTLLQLLPAQKRQNTLYGASLAIQLTGKIIGAALAFPMLSGGSGWVASIIALTLLIILLCFYVKPFVDK